MANSTCSSNNISLQDLLADSLPKDIPFTFYHYSTPPIHSPALFSAPPHAKPERTFCESHFLAASITPGQSGGSNPTEELLVLAIEVLVYSTKTLTTIFVSKADSTGYLSALQLPRSHAASPLKSIAGTFVSWLARERQREGKRVVISLFARAQDQYLFPASIDNPQKHVLDDRGLVKWWCQVLDPIVREYVAEEDKKTLVDRFVHGEKSNGVDQNQHTARGYLVIPGFEAYDTLRYIPSPSSPPGPRRWATTHPLLQIAPKPGAPPRCLVPHFPDDPKSRFLDELDEELPDRNTDAMTKEGGTPSRSNGQWKSVKTLDQFWEMMAYRQECSSGRIVGFIWVVISPPRACISEDENHVSQASSQPLSQDRSLGSNNSDPGRLTRSSPRKKVPKKPRRRKVNTEVGPIPRLAPRILASSSNLSSMSDGSTSSAVKMPLESTPYYSWPASSRGSLLFSNRDYNRANEVLLQQSFATQGAAARSTQKWKSELGLIGGVEHWSWTVTGRREGSDLSKADSRNITPVTMIGVRKKRKPDEATDRPLSGQVNTLEVGLVRKKPKT